MYVISANGASFIDLTGMTIQLQTREFQMEPNGPIQTEQYFEIIGFGIGNSISLGTYQLEQQARAVFGDILAKLRQGKVEFYDVCVEEKKFVGRVG